MEAIISQDACPAPKNLIAKKPRNATFELLRIVAMLFIVSHHFFVHGGWRSVPDGANSFFVYLTSALFNPSVNIFVMISAYFMCTRDDMKVPWKKLLKLYIPTYFYSAVLYIVFTAAGVYEFESYTLLQTLFPVLLGKYWFVSAYFVMMIASPFLNMLVKRLNKAQLSFVCVAIFVFAALQDVGVFQNTLPLNRGYSGWWFCMLYVIAAYIRKYDVSINSKLLWAICSVAFIGIVMLLTFIWTGPGYNSVVTTYLSIFIFLAAKNIKITNARLSKVICSLSRLTFGVYLIHDSNEMRGWMYENLFHSSKFIPSQYSFLIYLGFVLLTYVACSLIEWIRELGFKGISALIRHIFGDKLDRAGERFKAFIKRTADKINSTDKTLSPVDMSDK